MLTFYFRHFGIENLLVYGESALLLGVQGVEEGYGRPILLVQNPTKYSKAKNLFSLA